MVSSHPPGNFPGRQRKQFMPCSIARYVGRLDAGKSTRKHCVSVSSVSAHKMEEFMNLVQSLLVGIGVALMLSSSAEAADLKVGDKAPEFEMKGSDGKTYKLSQFKDKQAVVVAWYPKAFTGG